MSGNKPGGGPSPRSSTRRLPCASIAKQAGAFLPTPEISRSTDRSMIVLARLAACLCQDLTSPLGLRNQPRKFRNRAMKVRNSLKSLRGRHRDNRVVRRKGRVYVINKTQRRFKARQG